MQQIHLPAATVLSQTNIGTQPATGINPIQLQPVGATVYTQTNVDNQEIHLCQPGPNSTVCSMASTPSYSFQKGLSSNPISVVNSPPVAPPSYEDAIASTTASFCKVEK